MLEAPKSLKNIFMDVVDKAIKFRLSSYNHFKATNNPIFQCSWVLDKSWNSGRIEGSNRIVWKFRRSSPPSAGNRGERPSLWLDRSDGLFYASLRPLERWWDWNKLCLMIFISVYAKCLKLEELSKILYSVKLRGVVWFHTEEAGTCSYHRSCLISHACNKYLGNGLFIFTFYVAKYLSWCRQPINGYVVQCAVCAYP